MATKPSAPSASARLERSAIARRAAPADCHRRCCASMRQAFNTLQLTDGSRAVLKGEVPVHAARAIGAGPAKDAQTQTRQQPQQPRHADATLNAAGAATLRRPESLAGRSGARAQPARLCDFSRRHAGRHRRARPAIAWTTCKASAALAPKSWKPMATKCCVS